MATAAELHEQKSHKQGFRGNTRKVSQHVSQNEGLIFEKSSPGKKAYRLSQMDVPVVDTAKELGSAYREDLGLMPEVSEIEIIRHFTRLSTWNVPTRQLHDEVQQPRQRICIKN